MKLKMQSMKLQCAKSADVANFLCGGWGRKSRIPSVYDKDAGMRNYKLDKLPPWVKVPTKKKLIFKI